MVNLPPSVWGGCYEGSSGTPTMGGVNRANSTNAFRVAWREMLIILVVWSVLCAWVVGVCAWQAYDEELSASLTGETITTVVGFPSWVVWGIALPWLVANVFTVWFCLAYMSDEDTEGPNDG